MMFRGLSFTIGVIAIRMDCLVLARNFCVLRRSKMLLMALALRQRHKLLS